MLKNAKRTHSHGFTIVELLVVVVVIAILAAITIVTYSGVQSRAKTSAAVSSRDIFIKKVTIANQLLGRYPGSLADFELNRETSIAGTGIVLSAAALDGGQSPSTFLYQACGSTPSARTGATIRHYDFGSKAMVVTTLGDTSGTCAVVAS